MFPPQFLTARVYKHARTSICCRANTQGLLRPVPLPILYKPTRKHTKKNIEPRISNLLRWWYGNNITEKIILYIRIERFNLALLLCVLRARFVYRLLEYIGIYLICPI